MLFRAARRLPALGLLALAATFALPAAAQATFDDIRNRKAVVVGYRDTAPPFSLHDAAGRPVGYALDFCAPIVEQLKQRTGVTTVRMVPVELSRAVATLKSGGVHLVCSNLSDTPDRRRDVAFSPPIFLDGQQVAVKADGPVQSVADLRGRSVGFLEKSSAEATVKARAADGWKPRAIAGTTAALGQLELGWVEGYVRDGVPLALQIAAAKEPAAWRILPERLTSERIAIAYAAADAQMAALVDEQHAAAVRSGQARAWYERWFMQPVPPQGRNLKLPMGPELAKLLGG